MDCIKNNNLNQNDIKDRRKIKTHFVTWDKKMPSEIALQRFQKIIERKYNKKFESYWDLHKWSIKNFPKFWEEMWIYFGIIVSKPHEKVFKKIGCSIIDNDWFCGALFNIAENFLRIRDNRAALSFNDEFDNKGEMTFGELFEEVKLYVSAFRKHGLRKGDRLGVYISNCKEAVFAFLAALSIGAIWVAATPYFGSRALFKMMKVTEPKLLIVVDRFFYNEEELFPIENLTLVTEGVPSLEKIIVIRHPANKKTPRNLPNIPKSVLLEDFLASGRSPNGSVPDLVFEQLPPNHPAIITFTSGTTGNPKGVLHSHVTFIGFMRDYLHYNLKSGDVICNYCPPGWAPWAYGIPSLALGVKQFLFDGSPVHKRNGRNFWDHLSENKVTCMLTASSDANDMESKSIIPGPNANLDCLKIIILVGCPPLPKDYKFLLNKVKEDLFIGSQYGCTELQSTFSGIDLNMPAYACESQAPALGVDVHCFDSKGDSVVGQRGEMVVTTPTPSFPMCLWGDKNNERLRESYFAKYGIGVWCQNDDGYINPDTKGFFIIGRSDNILKQYGTTLSPDDLYIAIEHMEELKDFICVCQDSVCEEPRNILFVQLKEGCVFTPELKEEIKKSNQRDLSEMSVPAVIMEVPGIPRYFSHKRMERLVKEIVMTNIIPEVNNIRNPDCLKYFCDIPEIVDYN